MTIPVIIRVNGGPKLHGEAEIVHPGADGPGSWSVGVGTNDDLVAAFFARQPVQVEINAGFIEWTGTALPIHLYAPRDLHGSSVTLVGCGELIEVQA